MEQLIDVLTTNALGAEKVITISAVGPLINALVYQHLAMKDIDSDVVKSFKAFVAQDLKRRFKCIFDNQPEITAPLIAAFLDPRHKHLPFLHSEDEKLRVQTEVKERLEVMYEIIADESPETDRDTETELRKRHRMEEGEHGEFPTSDSTDPTTLLLGKTYSEAASASGKISCLQEIERYVTLTPTPTHEDPLKWWSKHTEDFPQLSKIARAYLAIPATSVSSERLFSAAGRLVSKNRSRLKPQNVNAILFLNKNK